MSGDQHNSVEHLRKVGSTSGGWIRALSFAIATLVIVFLALNWIELPGGSASSDLPQVMAAGGCFDIEVESVEYEPPVPIEEAEKDARQQIDELIERRGWTQEPGDLTWARFGDTVPGGYTDDPYPRVSAARWVLIFEGETQSALQSFFSQRPPRGWNVMYDPDSRTIGAFCGGPVY